jgi:hypothetical protein
MQQPGSLSPAATLYRDANFIFKAIIVSKS